MLSVSNARARIRMSPDEVAAFLDAPHKLQLGTINPDGTPHLVSMYYALVDGRIAFWTYRTAQKAKNLRRDPRVTCLVETGEGYDQLRGVMVRGKATATDDFAEVRRIGGLISARYRPGDLDMAVLAPYLDHQASKRTVFTVQPTKVASWDHRKLAGAA